MNKRKLKGVGLIAAFVGTALCVAAYMGFLSILLSGLGIFVCLLGFCFGIHLVFDDE